MTLRLATRRSPLAIAQAESVAARLVGAGVDVELVEVVTRGDRDASAPLSEIGGEGAFVVEVQRAVLEGRADGAVHSAKDLPSTTPAGLVLSAVPERRDPADAMVGSTLDRLGPGATVATGSPRRRALVLSRRPDLRVVGLRGNMDRRLAAAGRDGVDAVVVATAALERLARVEEIAERLDPSWFTPQVGQGAIAIESREDDPATLHALGAIDDEAAHAAVTAERSFLAELAAGCNAPLGALARVEGGVVRLAGVMLALDGEASARGELAGTDPRAIGVALARHLRDDRGGAGLAGWAP
ncbi:MAG TPA: hydroxymethylbilane synthase [Acidimicrobiales bacterium]|nr:hydroxymethylbilane synthase [Acidimicrobiales bacterium]